MKLLRNVFIALAILVTITQPVFAQFTILPSTTKTPDECKTYIASMEAAQTPEWFLNDENVQDTLACGIVTGNISLLMIPYFIKYFANFLLSLVGVIAMLFVVLGGYWYVFGGLLEQKEKGKKYIANALKGMVIAILSWVIVTVIISVVTA